MHHSQDVPIYTSCVQVYEESHRDMQTFKVKWMRFEGISGLLNWSTDIIYKLIL